MNKLKITLWGCGKIGHAITEIISETNHKIVWFYDKKLPAAAILSKDFNTGKALVSVPYAEFFPKCDLIIDATGDSSLLPYWKEILELQKVKSVILTRREPRADIQIMPHSQNQYPLPYKITAIGSCTGNAVVPLLTKFNDRFNIVSASARVLHPIKAEQTEDLKVIPTALNKSVFDFNQELAEKCYCQSMELPVIRGMAVDISITFQNTISEKQVKTIFKEIEEQYFYFKISDEPLSALKSIKQPYTAILEPDYKIIKNTLRFLIWQDNEYGFASSIKYYIDNFADLLDSRKNNHSIIL